MDAENRALIFDIKRGCSEDGPGIRTTVFFKGCPLRCVWCQNPEGISPEVEISSAGETVGNWLTLDELLYRIAIDRPFYSSSGGGVTLSGGEPSMQMSFVRQLLRALKRQRIHTAIETCGLFDFSGFQQQLLPCLDLIYFDLKLFDEAAAIKYTGVSNRLILDNFTRLAALNGIQLIARIPLIPEITSSAENLSNWADFLHKHGVEDCQLLPYNPLWGDKLTRLGKACTYRHEHFMDTAEQERCVHYFQPLN